jgi:hypothetical protein
MRRVLVVAVGGMLAAACTFLSPLDYLQNGDAIADAQSEDGPIVPGDEKPVVTPDVFASGQALPNLVAVDDKTVYWHIAGDGGAILALEKAGGTPRTVAAAAAAVEQLVVSTDAVYWAQDKQIRRAPKQGGDGGSDVAYTAQFPILGFAVDDTSIYVIENDENTGDEAVGRASKADGGRLVLDNVDAPTAIAVDSKMLYWADSNTTEVHAIPKGAGPDAGRTIFGNDTKDPISPDTPLGFAIDDTAMFWSESINGIIGRHLLAAGVNGTSLYTDPDTNDSDLGDISIDANYVWFTKLKTGTLMRVPKAGGTMEVRADGQLGIGGFASDGASVYFAIQGSGADGKILRIPAN